MKCPECQATNDKDALSCGNCGAALPRKCPSCANINRAHARFCDTCGTALAAQVHVAETVQVDTVDETESNTKLTVSCEAERRQLTVMFCDLVDSTVLSELLDPEELREVMRAYQRRGTAAISRFGGYVARYLGDGLLAYFGYPQAHEDSPQRAVHAAREILGAMPHLNAELRPHEVIHRAPLRVRIGIHTGLVVVGDLGVEASHESMAIVGETPNVAARIQALAEPNTVVISGFTKKLVETRFVCESLGFRPLKGISTPMELYRVLGESTDQSHSFPSGGTSLTPMVGRREELDLLLERWEQARQGQSRVVLLKGEPGIGKTRLMRELKEHIARQGCTQIELRCLRYYQNTALQPVVEHLRQLFQFDHDDTPQEKLAKLEHKLNLYRLSPSTTVPLFAPLLSLPHAENYPPLDLSPFRQKQKTLQALIDLLIAEAQRNPVLAAWEDLHWADASTLELLDLFVQQAPASRILVLVTFRPDFSPPWDSHPYLTTVSLGRLSDADVRTLVEELTRGKALKSEIAEQIVGKTDGVPLFVEELTKMLCDSGPPEEQGELHGSASPNTSLAIPATLQDLLMARLDKFVTARRVAQLAATLGREFRYDFLRMVSPLPESALKRELDSLVNAELLYQRGVPPHGTYMFKHALIQEAAYQSLLRSTRREYHARIADALEQHFPDTVHTQPELLAHHLTKAGLGKQAARYWYEAARRSIERSGNLEAIAQLKNGLEVLGDLPETPERIHQELMMQALLGMALIFAKGYSEGEVERAYARARALCGKLGETPLLYPVLWGLWAYYLVCGKYEASHGIGKQLLTMAERQQDADLLIEAHATQGQNSFFGGSDLAAARAHFERVGALYDLRAHTSHALVYGQDPGVVALATLSWTLWLQGYPDQALSAHLASLELAQARSHQYSLAYALAYGATFRQFRRETEAAEELAQRAIALSTERGFPMWTMAATYTLGWTFTRAGETEKATSYLSDAIQAWHAMGARITRPHQLGLLADALAFSGQAEQGLEVLKKATAEACATNERYYEPELYRLTGEALLLSSAPDEERAGAEFLRAIECARDQGAKSWELRAATSLARLRMRRGENQAARAILEDVYRRFTEGFDTPDLLDAQRVLAELTPIAPEAGGHR
jgi:class 3 adenylate cyclase/predicted ATPase